MIKNILLPLTLAFCSILVVSCRRSSHCIVKDSSGNVIKDYGSKSGTLTDVKNYENSCKMDANQYNGKTTCK